jgi:archaellum component FlaD/FlaE
MGEVAGTGGAPVTESQSPEELRQQIEETRRELGETVEELSAKTDVKARTQQAIDEKKAAVAEKVQEAKTTVTETTSELLGKAREVTPDSAMAAAATGQEKVRQNPVPAAVAGAFVAGFLLGRWTRR